MSEWISVKDRLPEENENVILYDGKEVFCGDLFFGKLGKICWGIQACDGICYGHYNKDEVTHWMPLPKPPKENL
jgi:hypothetical protein